MLPLRVAYSAVRAAGLHSIRVPVRSIAGPPPPSIPTPPPPPQAYSRPLAPPRQLAVRQRRRIITGMLTVTSSGLMASAVMTPSPLLPSFFVERRGLLTGVGSSADPTVSLELAATAHCIPHPSKANKPGGTGEDAWFVSRSGSVYGVADGVGGWATWGVDPALYAKALMAAAQKAADAEPSLSPKEVMQRAYDAPTVKKVVGTSTACIAAVRGTTVHVANLGDSGAMLVRDGMVAHRTREQQHSFNCPYQLGTDSNDVPKHADEYVWPGMQRGDVLILGTDGLWDNLFDETIAAEVALYMASRSVAHSGVQVSADLAQRIARRAFEAGKSEKARTPFWTKPGGPRGVGGKLDDITVLVAIAGSSSPPDSPRRDPVP